MAQTLNLNPFGSINTLGNTLLTNDTTAGVSSIPVANSNNFTAGYILLGAPGGDSTEMVTCTDPSSSTAIQISGTTTLPHNSNDSVIQLFGNQIKVYSAPDIYGNGTQPPDTDFNLVGITAINGSSALTVFTDNGGIPGTWYKFTIYNSLTNSETLLSSATAAQAGVVHYVSLDDIRLAAGMITSKNVTDDIIAKFRDSAEKEVNGALLAVYSLPLPLPIDPIVVQITKNIAAGELKHEMYQNVDAGMAKAGENLSSSARKDPTGKHTSLADLVSRDVVLENANYIELTVDEAHGFGGYPNGSPDIADDEYLPEEQRMPFRIGQEW